MGKFGVGVGDEFPAEEIRRDEDGVVHHYHYRYRRRPFRLLRLVLVIALIGMVFRALNYAWEPRYWAPLGHDGWSPFFPLGGLLISILVVSGALWLLSRRDTEGRC
jgi:ABC-type phosphate/phosphonate transport system permease subunit